MKVIPLLTTLLIGGSAMAADTTASTSNKTALFGGGCFWCMQPAFDRTPGVSATQVGYTGGAASTATYEQVSRGDTGHVEAIQVTYDPAQVTYAHLLKTYLENIDPTDGEGQFADRGTHYMPAIYYADTAQQQAAEQALAAIAPKFAPKPISVKLLPASDHALSDFDDHLDELFAFLGLR